MVEYWRWWVVHLWVEGFFEVFATAVIALPVHAARPAAREHARRSRCCSRPSSSWPAACSARCITCTSPARRPRWSRSARASRALEVVPLAFIGFEAYHTCKLGQATPWMAALPLADPVLHRGGVLEPGRRGTVRLPDQPAAVALLHAGPQPHAAARPHRAVRRVRHARHRR